MHQTRLAALHRSITAIEAIGGGDRLMGRLFPHVVISWKKGPTPYHTTLRRSPIGRLSADGHYVFQSRSDGQVRQVDPAKVPEMVEYIVYVANKLELGQKWMADQAMQRQQRQTEAAERTAEADRLARLREAAPDLLDVAKETMTFLLGLTAEIAGADALLVKVVAAIAKTTPAPNGEQP